MMRRHELVTRTPLPVSAELAWAWHARPASVDRLALPWEDSVVEEWPTGLEVGTRVVKRSARKPDELRVKVRTAVDPGRSYREEQAEGPYASWSQTRTFHPSPDGTCELEDAVEYECHTLADEARASVRVRREVAWRHRLLKSDLSLAAAKAAPRVFAVTGASGLVGSALVPFLEALGHTVRPVQRRPDNGVVPDALDGAWAVVHLAGAGVADARWTAERKKLLSSSRVDFTAGLVRAMGSVSQRPQVLVSGSAIGVYGHRRDEVLSEQSPPGPGGSEGAGFLAGLCVDWEAAGLEARSIGARVVLLRTGIVLSPRGGMLARLLPVYKLGAGGPTGPGTAWLSWISIEDELRAIHEALFREELQGPLNAVTPNPVTGIEFAHLLGRVLARPAMMPLPAFALRMMFGEMADGALLASQRVRPEVLEGLGFSWEHPGLEVALRALLGRPADD